MKDIPAFPREDYQYGGQGFGQVGMTLRDYFAAKAMQGDIARDEIYVGTLQDEELLGAARVYYRVADSMLKAREE